MTAAVTEKPVPAKPKAPKGAKMAAKPADSAAQTSSTLADVPSASVEEAKAGPSVNDRYADEEVRKEVADGIKAARALGWTRPQLSALVAEAGGSMGGSALWRSEAGKVNKDEVEYIRAALAKCVEPPAGKPTKASTVEEYKARIARLDAAIELLDAGPENKTLGAARALLDEVQAVLKGDSLPE